MDMAMGIKNHRDCLATLAVIIKNPFDQIFREPGTKGTNASMLQTPLRVQHNTHVTL